jgi:RsiW-degrading membrane proteinase PrsW (M82 family)/RNA polymerase subunit RPABC4/transcription elongation factor Spt4
VTAPVDEVAGSTAESAAPLRICHNCGMAVPEGEFCGACGAHLAAQTEAAARRRHAYAVHPGEHVFHFSIISTLFPHLPHRHSLPFQLALFLAAAALLVLGLLRLTGPAIAAAALLVPVLYLIYFWEAEVYEDEPVRVIGATFGIGALLGISWAILTGPSVAQTLTLNIGHGVGPGALLLAGVLFPVVAQALMLVGPLLLYFWFHNRFDETLDGFTFGAASGLGFAVTTTIVNLLPELRLGLISDASTTVTTLSILQRGLLIPVLHASTTGIIAAAAWLRRGRVRSLGHHGWTTTLAAALAVSLVLQIGLALLDLFSSNPVITVGAYAVAVGLLMLAVRVALHHMLLAEAVEVSIGADYPCAHCARMVPRMAFCPNCGIAVRATPKTAAGRLARETR